MSSTPIARATNLADAIRADVPMMALLCGPKQPVELENAILQLAAEQIGFVRVCNPLDTPNPRIDFDGWKLAVVDAPIQLPEQDKPLVFGVNSFGFGGTNAHAVIREYRAPAAVPTAAPAHAWSNVLLLSAQSEPALAEMARTQAAWLRTQDAAEWPTICATAALCRSRLGHRLAVVAGSCDEAADQLERFGAGQPAPAITTGRGGTDPARVAFVYSGNGPQWFAMGRELLAACPDFRAEVEAVDALFRPKTGWSLIEELNRPEEQSRMAQTEIAQPTLFALQLGLTAVLRAAGITPAAVFGHSVGEVAAAHVAGALDRAQATEVIFQRSAMQARTAGTGRMAALGIGADEAAAAMADCGGWLELAARNAPRAVTVAGDPAALETLRDRLTDAGKFARLLPLDYAFHSRAMDPIEGDLLARLAGLRPSETHTPFISTVDGCQLPGAKLDATYWWRNIREPVRFADAVAHVLGECGITHFVEIGPHPVLRDYVLQCAKAREIAAVALPTLRRPSASRAEPEMPALWAVIAACHANDLARPEAVFARPARPAALPTYPWQRSRHWRGWVPLPDNPSPTHREHPLLGWRPRGTNTLWQNSVDLGMLPYLRDHVVQGSVLFPAAGYVELGLAAAGSLFGDGPLEIETFDILRPFVVTARPIAALETTVDSADGTIEIRSRPDMFSETWTTHHRARVTRGTGASPPRLDLAAIKQGLVDRVDGAAHYADSAGRGLAYGPAFQGVREVFLSPVGVATPTALAEISLPETALEGYRAHPAVLDSCIQVLITLLGRTEGRQCAFIPVQIGRFRSYAPLPAQVMCLTTVTRETSRSGSADIGIYDMAGQPLVTIHEARFRKVDFQSSAATNHVTEGWRVDPAVAGSEVVGFPAPETMAAGDTASAAVDELVGAYACQALRELGAAEGPFRLPQLQRRARVLPTQAGLLAQLVAMAEADGALVQEGGSWRWIETHEARDPNTLWRSLMLAHPAYAAELLLAGRHGERLVTTLRDGSAEAGDKPDAATDLLHDGSPSAAASTRAVQSIVTTLLAAWRGEGRLLRVLELGQGSGLTASMLPILPASRADYVLANRSQIVLDRAKQRFSGHHGFSTRLFDLDADSAADTLTAGGFDLVLMDTAPSALLDRVAALLAPGGWLVAMEPAPSRLQTLLTGGTGPILQLVSDDEPEVALHEAGFASVAHGPGVLMAQRAPTALARPERANVAAASWLLLTGSAEAAFAQEVAGALRGRGQSVETLLLGASGAAFASASDMDVACGFAAQHIVHLAGLAPEKPAEMLEQQDLRCLSTLSLVQAIKSAEQGYKPLLHLVTHGAFAGPGLAGPLDPGQAPLWGLGRVLSNEHPDLAPHLIDLCRDLDADAATLLTDELLRTDEEMEVRIGTGQRLVNRMQPMSVAQLAADAAARPGPFRLEVGAQGGIDSLFLRAVPTAAPRPGEVEIRIRAAGLNYRDVLWTMGMLPEEAVEHGFSGATIGMECAGEVSAVGEGVSHLAVGDRVVAFASSTFASHVVTDAGAVMRLPAEIGFAEAATIPTAFLTAYYALDQLARLRAGERVLIHGAAGGVGLAAVQIAQLRGAVVFGSAGSDEKRRVLARMGVDHVLDSRSLDFADDVMRLTGGKGLDVVLNSLAGDAINKNLQILRPFGRFLEIGKRDFYANSRIGLRPFRNNLSYFGIDVDTLLIERQDLAQSLFAEVMALFGNGALRPLPFTPIPISRAAEAFRLMQQSRHIGKIVLTVDPADAGIAPVTTELALRPDATYLVTGGLGGFGLATAKWLVEKGARHLALVSRRGATTDEAKDGIAVMEAAGATVRAFAADVTRAADVAAVMGEIAANMPPLRGLIHAAMVLDDGPIMKLDGERLRRVLAPKLLGARHLHDATLGLPLDHFVMYSSGTTVVGNPGQGNYVAANLYLDALAQHRRTLGLPALAVAWGAIKDVGVLARNVGVEEMLQNRTGMGSIPAAEALIDLGRLMAVGANRVSVAQFNLQRLGTLLPGTRTPRFLPMASDSVVAQLTQSSETLASILAETPAEERRAVVIARLRDHVGRVLGTGAGQVDVERSLPEMGLDSLMAVELAESLEQDIGKPVSVMQLIQAGSVLAISELVMGVLDQGGGSETDKLAAD